MDRGDFLKDADAIVNGFRQENYGDARAAHNLIADGWSLILGVGVEAHQVALMMDWLKTVRCMNQPSNPDHWVDKLGYAALGGEFAMEDAGNRHQVAQEAARGATAAEATKPEPGPSEVDPNVVQAGVNVTWYEPPVRQDRTCDSCGVDVGELHRDGCAYLADRAAGDVDIFGPTQDEQDRAARDLG